MTRRDFTARSDALNRRESAQTLTLFGMLVIGEVIAIWIERHQGPDSPYGIVSLIPFLGYSAWIFWQWMKFPRRFGLVCPHCTRALTRPERGHALMTGKCRRCGRSIFTETPDGVPRSARIDKLSKDEFAADVNARQLRTNRRLAIMLSFGAVTAVGCVPLVMYLNHLTDLGRLEWRYPVAWAVLGLFAGLLLLLLVLFVLAATGRRKPFGIPCPACGKSIAGPVAQVVIATTRCVYCGEEILRETT